MARSKGSANFSGSLEVLAGAPLDARLVVNTKADLTATASYPYKYIGMIVSVKSEGRAYMLIGNDTTVADNWKIVGGDSLDVVVYRPAGSIFFADRPATLSSDLVGNVYYIKDDFTTTADFVEGAGNEYAAGTSIYVIDMGTTSTPDIHWDVLSASIDLSVYQLQLQYDTLPEPSVDIVNKIYQYTGASNAYYVNGYFYKCIENPSDPGHYIYVNVETQEVNGFIEQTDTIPSVTGLDLGRIIQYTGATTTEYINGYFYEVVEDAAAPGSFIWVQKNIQPDQDTKIQVEVMPAASAATRGQIVQYIGASRGDLENGYFYECIKDDELPNTYLWVQKNIQPDKDTIIQVETMPSAVVATEGRIVQFIGETNAYYTNGYFYKCIEDTAIPGSYKWAPIPVQEGGSGGSLSKAITAAIDVGGISAGDNFAVGTSFDRMWDALLNPTLYPTYVAPSASLTYSAETYYEVGATIAAKTGTITYNAGAININGTKQNNRAGAATKYSLASAGADVEYTSQSTTSGTFNVNALTRASKGTINLTATVNYAEGPQPKDSKGEDYGVPLPAGSVTAIKTMNFILPYYYGKSSTPTVSSFTGLTKNVTAKGQKQFNFTTNNEYMVFAYDSSYGNLSSILDPNSFETISGWNKTTLTVDGFSYYVYVAKSATTDTNAKFTFKY